MTRSVLYRTKAGPGAWLRATGTPESVTLPDLNPGTIYEFDVGDGVIREEATLAIPFAGFLDDFDRPNENLSASADWETYGEPTRLLEIISGRVRSTGSSTQGYARSASAWNNNHWAEVDVVFTDVAVAGGNGVGALVRVSADGQTGYRFLAGHAGEWNLQRWNAGPGTNTVLVSGTVAAPGATYTVRLEAEGSTLRGYINGTLITTQTDATYATGRPGLSVNPNSTNRNSHEADAVRFDNL